MSTLTITDGIISDDSPLPRHVPSSIRILQVFCAFTAFLIAFLAAYFRLKYADSCCGPRLIALSNVWASGVFVGMALNHLIPEATELTPEVTSFFGLFPCKINLVGVCVFTGYGIILYCERVLSVQTAMKGGKNSIMRNSVRRNVGEGFSLDSDLNSNQWQAQEAQGYPCCTDNSSGLNHDGTLQSSQQQYPLAAVQNELNDLMRPINTSSAAPVTPVQTVSNRKSTNLNLNGDEADSDVRDLFKQETGLNNMTVNQNLYCLCCRQEEQGSSGQVQQTGATTAGTVSERDIKLKAVTVHKAGNQICHNDDMSQTSTGTGRSGTQTQSTNDSQGQQGGRDKCCEYDSPEKVTVSSNSHPGIANHNAHSSDSHHDHDHSNHDDHNHFDFVTSNNTNSNTNSKGAYIIMLALSVHAVFEGLVVGLATKLNILILVCCCVLGHKWAAGFSIGTAIAKSYNIDNNNTQQSFSLLNKSTRKPVLFLTFFTLSSPIGILIGMVISHFHIPVLEGISNAVSAGTLIYVACSEILVEEFSKNPEDSCKKLGAFILGFLIIVLIQMMDLD